MKRVFQIALLGVLSMGAVAVQAQDNWHGGRDGRDRSAYVDNNRREQYSGGRDNDRRDDRYRGGDSFGYSDRGYQTYHHSDERSAAITRDEAIREHHNDRR